MRDARAGRFRSEPTPKAGQARAGKITRLPTREHGRRAAGPVAPPLGGQRDNLPAPLTSFVGREREVVEIARLLETDRLVTLTGAPGVGKTRLALRVAEEVRDRFGDGVWLVELAALAEPALVPAALARELGVRDRGARPLAETLAAYPRPRSVLLVLDNCEHLLDGCATLVDALLREEVESLLAPMDSARLDRALEPARRALGSQASDEARADGRAIPLAEAIELALRQDEPVDRATPAPVAPRAILTRREGEIAGLVARGLSNRQIADALVVSERTVEWHVANVLGKLALETRAQLAVWAIGEGGDARP